MANPEHLKILKQGVEAWNKWREENPEVRPDLSGENFLELRLSSINLENANLYGIGLIRCSLTQANLNYADVSGSDLAECFLHGANMIEINLQGSRLSEVELTGAKMNGANLRNTDLFGVNFNRTKLVHACLEDVDLRESHFIQTDLSGASIKNALIYGISVWDIKTKDLSQENLIIKPSAGPSFTVDDLEVAQFIYLMLNNEKIKHVIEEITSKAVPILGRFGIPERKAVLDAVKDKLRKIEGKYLPIVFDFEGPVNQKMKDTVILLARMSKFIIVDVTDPSSAPYEIGILDQNNIRVPIQPIIQKSQQEFSMLPTDSPFLPIYRYDTQESLLENIASAIIAPAEEELTKKSLKK